jgi:glucosamine--fructose-6-phosphate aminotransferase (isomerizing)
MIAYKLKNLDKEFIDNVYECINSINFIFKDIDLIKELAIKIKDYPSLFYIGKGMDHLVNLESSLKMKEVSYIHSEAFYSGELKHGSIALISKDSFVLGLISNLNNLDSFMNNIKEVDARESKYFLVSTSNVNINSNYVIRCNNEYFSSICISSFYQLLSYYVAYFKGLDIDKPRNLAKSCTVE